MSSVSYFALSGEDLDKLIRDASQSEELISPETAASRFDCSVDFLEQLRREGKIKKYTIPGHPKIKRYSLKELQGIFITE